MVTIISLFATLAVAPYGPVDERPGSRIFIERYNPYYADPPFVALAVPTAEPQNEIRRFQVKGYSPGLDEASFQFFRIVDSLPRRVESISAIRSGSYRPATYFDFNLMREVTRELPEVPDRMLIVGCYNLDDPEFLCGKRHVHEARLGEVVPVIQLRTKSTQLSRGVDMRKVVFKELAKIVETGGDAEVTALISEMAQWQRQTFDVPPKSEVDTDVANILVPAFESRSRKPGGAYQAASMYAGLVKHDRIEYFEKTVSKLQLAIERQERPPLDAAANLPFLIASSSVPPEKLNGNSLSNSVFAADPYLASCLVPFLKRATPPTREIQRRLVEADLLLFAQIDQALCNWHKLPYTTWGTEGVTEQRANERRQFWRERLAN